ncbi:MAG: MATE family efflux transporter [Saprospiraceae bacterium]|nr:MATE family efflux transporter [Saprospiraceae bacterium]
MSSTHPFLRLWRGRVLRAELKSTFWLALPLMLGELSSMLMGLTGTMMTGRLGETALAASGIASVVFVLSMLLVWGSIRMIPTPVAEAHELRDGTRVRTLLAAGLLMGLVLTVVCSALLQLGIGHFDLLRQDPEVARLAIGYLHIIVYSMPVLILFALLVNYVDAFGYVRLTMYISFFGLALDIFLNWLLIFGRYGLPRLGISAIALNTGISHAAMALALAAVLWRKAELQYFRSARTQARVVWRQMLEFFRYGIPSALQIMVEFAAFGAGTIIIGQISKTEQAAHQIAINLISATYVTIMGVSTAGMIRIGQALAYRSRVRIWLAGVSTLLLAMLIMVVPTLAFLLFPGSIVRLYIDDPAVLGIATTLVFLAGFFQLADAAQASTISLLRALNDVLVPSAISFVAFWLIGIPLGYWLAIHQDWHAKGIWAGYLVALLVQAVWFAARFFGLLRRWQPGA